MDAAPTSVASSPAAPKLGRRTYVIDRGFQLKYTLMLVVAGVVISALFGGMMYVAHLEAQRALDPVNALQAEFARVNTTLVLLMGSIAGMMAAAFGLFGILITHRVAGPVFVMSHYVSVLSKGRYPIMRPLRARDELKGFFERFQEAIEQLRQREAQEAHALEAALGALGPLASSPEARQHVEALKAMHQRKRDATDRVDVAGLALAAAEPSPAR